MEPGALLEFPQQKRLCSINVHVSELCNMAEDAGEYGVCVPDSSAQLFAQSTQQACSGPMSNDCDGSQHAESTQHMGDDFEALDADMLLEDAAFDTYPGGWSHLAWVQP
jgi:hypothetical protein